MFLNCRTTWFGVKPLHIWSGLLSRFTCASFMFANVWLSCTILDDKARSRFSCKAFSCACGGDMHA